MRRRPTFPAHAKARTAFTLLEMLVTIILIAIAAAMMVPMLASNDASYVAAGVGLMVADFDFAQSTAISDPSDNVAVHFDAAAGRWWITREGTPDTTLTMSNGEPYDTTMGQGRAEMAFNVAFTLDHVYGNKIVYEAFGRLVQSSSPTITVTSGGASSLIVIDAETGFLTAQ